MSIIAVTGSTGSQGGSVARALLQSGKWKVRGITRNTASKSAQALAAAGAEMVQADLDDVNGLSKAFEGVYGVFALTNFWEHIGTKGADGAGKFEAQQAFNCALAASKIPSLQHFIFSTLQEASVISKGKRPVPHMDYKGQVDEKIRKELPGLAQKTTFMWLGWYSGNMANMPLIKPFEMPTSGKWVWAQPSPPKALLPISGDVGTNVGVFVSAILANPAKTHGRYVNVKSEIKTFEEILKVWSEVTGKDAVYVELTLAEYEKIWGAYGREMAMQYAFGAENPDWEVMRKDLVVSPAELGVTANQLVGLKGNLEQLKAKLL